MVSGDHVHMLVSVPPQLAVSKLVQRLKGKTSYKLQREFKSLAQGILGPADVLERAKPGPRGPSSARGYFACSTGNVSSDMIAAYIEGHTDEEDGFKVTEE